MVDWMAWVGANLLKSAIVGMLSVISFWVHGPEQCEGPVALATPDAVVACAAPEDLMAVEVLELESVLLRVGSVVPPIRVETLYSPDVLHPAVVIIRRGGDDQAT